MINMSEIQSLANYLWVNQLCTDNENWGEIEAIASIPSVRKICRCCGEEFSRTPQAVYCKECSIRRADEARKRSRAKTKKKRFHLSPCKHCGRRFRRGEGQKYCQLCVKKSYVNSSGHRIFKDS